MSKILSFFLIAFSLYSCSSESDQIIKGFNYDGSINISLSNSNGDDLLNPANATAYDQSKIKILYLVQGQLIEKPNGTDYPRNFLLYEQDGHTIMRIFLNSEKVEKYPETYIQWNNNDTDIIKIDYNRTNNSVSKKTVWLNDQLRTDIVPYMNIVK